MIMIATDRKQEQRSRRAAHELGYEVKKSRAQRETLNDRGLFRLIACSTNAIIMGADYDVGLNEIDAWLHEQR
jgi:hypothetical protein